MNRGRKKAILLGSVVFLAMLGAYWYSRGPVRNEPIYRGKNLSQWLRQLDDGQAFGISSSALPVFTSAQLQAAEAIHAMGTNALPLLLQDIHSSPSPNAALFRFERRLNSALGGLVRGHISLGDITSEDRTRWRAAQGLSALGPLARPVIPELKRLLFTNYWHSSIKESAYALTAVGPEGIEILTNAISQENWSGMCAIWALGQHPAAGTNAIPALIRATSSADEGVACGAIQVLGLLRCDGEHVVPVLTAALASTNSSVRRDAARALGAFHSQAAAAVPALRSLTNDPAVKAEVGEALKKINSQ